MDPVKNSIDIGFLMANNNSNANTINNSLEDIEKELDMITKEEIPVVKSGNFIN